MDSELTLPPISLIAAMDKNRAIGSGGKLPWHLPRDMRRFVTLTKGKPIVMGRKTYESIGKPLPDRRNIILTTQADYQAPGCDIAHSVGAALEMASEAGKEIMIGGGSLIYDLFLPLAGTMYLTTIDAEFDGDVYFPRFDELDWRLVSEEFISADDKNRWDMRFVEWRRKRS